MSRWRTPPSGARPGTVPGEAAGDNCSGFRRRQLFQLRARAGAPHLGLEIDGDMGAPSEAQPMIQYGTDGSAVGLSETVLSQMNLLA